MILKALAAEETRCRLRSLPQNLSYPRDKHCTSLLAPEMILIARAPPLGSGGRSSISAKVVSESSHWRFYKYGKACRNQKLTVACLISPVAV